MEEYTHSDFIINKYYHWYFNIIRNALSRVVDNSSYYEKHHIIPNSIRKNNNKVKLTAKEHFICHHLLTKFVVNKSKYSIFHAYNCMVFMENDNQKRYKITSQQYANAKKLNALATSNLHKGRTFDEAYKQKIREGLSIGTFITPWGDFVSATQAAANCPTGKLSTHSILRYCKHENLNKLHIRSVIQSAFFINNDEGKTFNELGFSFISR